MKRFLIHASLLLLAVSFGAAPALAKKKADDAAASGDAVATVNGKPIAKSHADLFAAQLKSQYKAQGQPEPENLPKMVRDEMVIRELMAQDAQKKGYDKRPDVQMAQQAILLRAYAEDYMKTHQPTDEAVQAAYDKYRAANAERKEYHVQHILVEKEDDAKDIITRLHKGEKFEDLAKRSTDPGSKDKGGDLGWAKPEVYAKPFAEAFVKLKPGEMTEAPVQTTYGWHVIRLEDVRQASTPSLEEVKPQIMQSLAGQALNQHIEELKQKAKVE